MTSKECITRMLNDYEIGYDNFKNDLDRKNVIGMLDCIKKDLEILEILKYFVRHSPMTIQEIKTSANYDSYKDKCVAKGQPLATKTVYNEIKEWLENEY